MAGLLVTEKYMGRIITIAYFTSKNNIE